VGQRVKVKSSRHGGERRRPRLADRMDPIPRPTPRQPIHLLQLLCRFRVASREVLQLYGLQAELVLEAGDVPPRCGQAGLGRAKGFDRGTPVRTQREIWRPCKWIGGELPATPGRPKAQAEASQRPEIPKWGKRGLSLHPKRGGHTTGQRTNPRTWVAACEARSSARAPPRERIFSSAAPRCACSRASTPWGLRVSRVGLGTVRLCLQAAQWVLLIGAARKPCLHCPKAACVHACKHARMARRRPEQEGGAESQGTKRAHARQRPHLQVAHARCRRAQLALATGGRR
jgi:hypothetical protein